MVKLGPRAQAVTVLALVGTLGALVGVLGDRMIAQRRAEASTQPVGDTLSILSPQQQQRVPADVGDTMQPAPRRNPLQQGPPPGGPRPGGPPNPQMRFVEMIKERIDLTPEQRSTIDSIVAEERARIERVALNTRMQIDSIGRSTRMRLSAVLTPPQRQQLRVIQQERMRDVNEERRARILEGRGGRGRPGRRGGDTIPPG